jgi:uracil phosphoribosyltransferase
MSPSWITLLFNTNSLFCAMKPLPCAIFGLYAPKSPCLWPLRPLESALIKTPVAPANVKRLAGKKLALVAILRAGLIMTDGILNLVPNARIGHIGLYRDHDTLKPVEYFRKLPSDISERDVFVLDPMLATGGSAVAAIDILKNLGVKHLKLLCIIGAPEGVKAVHDVHPDIPIILAALDEKLNEKGYIVPGLGDAGDRIYGTK